MKTDIGVDPDYAVDRDDPELDAAITKLRPDCKLSFRDYIKKGDEDADQPKQYASNPSRLSCASKTSNHRKLE